MRIIAGEFRSRKLAVLDGFLTRPMPDRVRESVFGMLGERANDALVLDLFAGSGAIGLEALSRGARSVMFVERDRGAADVLERNIKSLRVESLAEVVVGDALGMSIPARAPRPLDLVFIDPPYPLVRDPLGWERVKAQASHLAALLAPDGFLIVRTPWPFVLDIPAAPVLSPGEPVPPEDGAAPPAPIARPVKRKKYKRPRERWENNPFAESFQDMKRSGERRQTPAPQPAAAEHGADEEDEAGGGGPEVKVTEPEGIPPSQHVMGDLAIPGCKGPETHAYGKTAVHWYMGAPQADKS